MIRNINFRQKFLKFVSFQRKCSNRTTQPANGAVAEVKESQEESECQEETFDTFKVG